jgi:predicted heme/steroid binding protein
MATVQKSRNIAIYIGTAVVSLVVAIFGFVIATARSEMTKPIDDMQTMSATELSQYDGKDGHKAYFAYEGRVYDVTSSPLFKNGDHPGGHKAGTDLTGKLVGAPHGIEVFAPFKVVAKFE